jgi:hypothetical protein
VKEHKGGPGTLSEQEKAAIILMHGKGMTYQAIADKTGKTRQAVHKFITKVHKAAETVIPEQDWKEVMRDKAIVAINAGLDHDEDPYKRGTLGIQAAKGLGVLQPDGAQIQINTLMASVPPGWKDRYMTVTAEE